MALVCWRWDSVDKGTMPPPLFPHTFWPILVAKGRDSLIEQSLTLIKQPFTLVEQSSLSFLIVSKCSGVNLVKSVAADFNSCSRMAKAPSLAPPAPSLQSKGAGRASLSTTMISSQEQY